MNKLPINLPNIFENEHLYGYVSRLCLLNGILDSNSIQKGIMGCNKALAALPLFKESTHELAIFISDKFSLPLADVFTRHTLLGLFRHNIDPTVLRKVVAKDYSRKTVISLEQTEVYWGKAWRYCPCCVEEDKVQHGTAYWHVEHQLPTSLTCYKHVKTTLEYKCQKCGLVTTNLGCKPIPTAQCEKCGHTHESMSLHLNRDQKSIQESGFRLFNDTSNFDSSMQYYMLDVDSIVRSREDISESLELRYKELDGSFFDWLSESELTVYFGHDSSIGTVQSLRAHRMVRYSGRAKLLYVLLWQRYFYHLRQTAKQ